MQWSAAPLFLAQCTPGVADCDLPHTLPWYFGMAIGVVWLATAVGALLVLRRRWLLRRDDRKARRSARPGRQLDRARERDVEVW